MIDKIWNAISKTPAKIIGNAFKINNAKVKAVSSVKPTTYYSVALLLSSHTSLQL